MDTANAMSIPRVDVEAEKRHAADDYYGLPAIKRSHYRWTAGTSFFLAGIAGVIEMLTRILYVSGHANDEKLVRAGTYLVPAVTGAAALLYIKDLGTPSRWFNMLRIFRPTSFMSVGSWSLTTLGIKSGIAAIMQYFSR